MKKIVAYIGVGSNLGDRDEYLRLARKRLEKIPGIHFLRSSRVHETNPVGGPPQGKYLNAVWEIETELLADELLDNLLAIEKALGRIRGEKNAPRTMDLDLLIYGNEWIDTEELKIPHPRLHERTFVLKPLLELAPNWMHPKFKESILTLDQKQRESIERNKKS